MISKMGTINYKFEKSEATLSTESECYRLVSDYSGNGSVTSTHLRNASNWLISEGIAEGEEAEIQGLEFNSFLEMKKLNP